MRTALEKPSAQRSYIMSRVRSTGTEPEERMAAALAAEGVAFDRNARDLPGKPDFALRESRTVVFVDGAFWHGRRGVPKTNPEFWRDKFKKNRARDKRVDAKLRAMGWAVIRMSEASAVKSAGRAAESIAALAAERERCR